MMSTIAAACEGSFRSRPRRRSRQWEALLSLLLQVSWHGPSRLLCSKIQIYSHNHKEVLHNVADPDHRRCCARGDPSLLPLRLDLHRSPRLSLLATPELRREEGHPSRHRPLLHPLASSLMPVATTLALDLGGRPPRQALYLARRACVESENVIFDTEYDESDRSTHFCCCHDSDILDMLLSAPIRLLEMNDARWSPFICVCHLTLSNPASANFHLEIIL